jgi:hypothetical protein
MSRRSLIVYNYHPVPEVLPPTTHKVTAIDLLDAQIDPLWNAELAKLMQPVGHPHSKRFFIQQYKAAQLLKTAAKAKGAFSIANMDDWALMSALRRVANRRGISPRQLLVTHAVAAE